MWQKLKAALAGSVRQQVTRTGVAFTAAILFVGVAAFISANNLLFLILAAMMSTLLISGFISRLGLANLELDLLLPEHISARRKVWARLAVRNQKWIPSFSIHVYGKAQTASHFELYLPVIPGRTTLEEPVEMTFLHRGLHRDNVFECSTKFPFGFTTRRVQVTLRRDVIIYPSVDPQPGFERLLAQVAGEVAAQQRGRGNDFYRIRPYEALESARHVDWKATAHTGALQVREFAREQDAAVAIFLDLDVEDKQTAWFERAVACCAYLAWHLAERETRLAFQTQEVTLQVPEEGDVYAILKYLALVAPKRGAAAQVPHDPGIPQIVLSPAADRLAPVAAGALLLGLDAFPDLGTGAAEAGTGDEFHHGRRADQRRSSRFRRRPRPGTDSAESGRQPG